MTARFLLPTVTVGALSKILVGGPYGPPDRRPVVGELDEPVRSASTDTSQQRIDKKWWIAHQPVRTMQSSTVRPLANALRCVWRCHRSGGTHALSSSSYATTHDKSGSEVCGAAESTALIQSTAGRQALCWELVITRIEHRGVLPPHFRGR